ncbi:probable multidrug and toxin extrusion protein 1 [Coccomyxa sp. Obi]|nr:probable multidrug and toxin extrusion protein 1 [Coccomyxa sp. Obi]
MSLRAPLLSSDRRPDCDHNEVPLWQIFKDELIAIIALAGPACVQLGSQQAVLVTNQIYAGSLGADALAAAAIGFTLFNLIWYFLLGVSSALDTLASQAYGAADRAGVISWAITAAIVMSAFGVPMAAALYYGEPIAIYMFRQNVEVAKLVAVYTRGMIPGLWPYIWSCVIMKALQAQNLMWAPAYVTVSMFFINIGFNAVLVPNYGFTGAAYAQSASRIVQFLLLVANVLTVGKACLSFDREPIVVPYPDNDISTTKLIKAAFDTYKEEEEDPLQEYRNGSPDTPLPPFPVDASLQHQASGGAASAPSQEVPYVAPTLGAVFADAVAPASFAEFLRLALPGGLMMQIEGNSFDITNVLASLLGTVQVDAHNVMLTLCEFSYVALPFGIATAATIRTGNMLGAGNHASARRSGYVCIALCMMFELVTCSLIFGFRHRLGYLFVDDEDVVALVSKIAVLAAVYQLPDGVYGTVSGILRGLGRQPQLLWVNLTGFWAVGMVVAVLLTFKLGFGEIGLWWGLLSGITATAAICSVMLALVDWPAEAVKAQELIARAAAEAAEAAAAASEDAQPDLEAAPAVHAPPSREGEGTSNGAADRWAHLPRRGAPARPLQIRRQNSLTTQPSYGSVRGHDLATRMFAPGVRN